MSVIFAQGAPVATAMRLTQSQMNAALIKAGATKEVAKVMAAISMCEAPYSAGGVSYTDCSLIGDQALADATWGYSYGYFQIRSKRAEKGKGTLRDERWLPEPEFNIKSALEIQRLQGFDAWSTWTNGTFKAFLPQDYPTPPGTYTVISGDSLIRITSKLGDQWSWPALAYVNGLAKPYTIYLNQHLLLPWTEHKVATGERLVDLVANLTHGVTQQQVVAFNNLISTIKVGQVLRFPRASYLEYLNSKNRTVA